MRTLPILFVALLLLGTAENLRAWERIIITDTLRDAATSRPVESVNVLLQDTAWRAVYNYAITGDNGVYRLESRGDADSVAVTGFNIHEEVRSALLSSPILRIFLPSATYTGDVQV